jgi:hypothetical protein
MLDLVEALSCTGAKHKSEAKCQFSEVAQTCEIFDKKLDTTSVSVLIEKLEDLVQALSCTATSHKS